MIPLRRGELNGNVGVWKESRSVGQYLLVRVALHGETDTFHLPFWEIMNLETETVPLGGMDILACHKAFEEAQDELIPALNELALVNGKIKTQKKKLEGLKRRIKTFKGVKFLQLVRSCRAASEEILEETA